MLSLAVVVVASLLAAACSSGDDAADPADEVPAVSQPTDGGDESPPVPVITDTSTSTTPTTAPPTLEERITANMQGAQRETLDIWGDPELGGLVFFHRSDWASEVTARPGATGDFDTGEYCERGTYAWSVADAKSESEFTIHYDALTEDPDCAAFGIERLTAVFTGAREVDGRLVYDFGYTAGLGTPDQPFTGTRIVCSDQWNDPEPCGLPIPGSVMSTPPN